MSENLILKGGCMSVESYKALIVLIKGSENIIKRTERRVKKNRKRRRVTTTTHKDSFVNLSYLSLSPIC